ncbi:MAG: alpha-hydroxy-acid oxidizing protein, partial [Promethearchaeota archaeon]
MTGGHPKVKKINEILARAASQFGIPMGLGSQRVGLDNENLQETYSVARDVDPDLFLIGNIGMAQLAKSRDPVETARKCVEMIDANAIAIHFNKLQELVQPEGDKSFSRSIDFINEIEDGVGVPVILKEVGMGFSKNDFIYVNELKISAIDVGGYGGTNFTAIEAFRTQDEEYPFSRNMGNLFDEVGIPTPASTYLGNKFSDKIIIATGGIRSGLDVVKSILVGASMAGIAYPILIACLNDINNKNKSITNLEKEIKTIFEEIKTTMVLLNAPTIDDLKHANWHFSPELRQWIV